MTSADIYQRYVEVNKLAFDLYIDFVRAKEAELREESIKRQLFRIRLADKVAEMFGSQLATELMASGRL